jgi:dihydropteroate synthase
VLASERSLLIGHHELAWGTRTYVMGILNITPDSFSGDGLLANTASPTRDKHSQTQQIVDRTRQQAREFVEQGIDILDVGGESTRPGAQPVTPEEEAARVIPVIRMLAEEFDVLLSVDTYRASVAEAALQAGAHIVNDVWGLKVDPGLATVAARHQAPVILMHNRSSWANAEIRDRLGGRYVGVPYHELVADVKNELLESVSLAKAAGIPEEHIILDPGIGFGKTVEQNLELVDRLNEIRDLGYPVLLGPSRKSFIGFTLNLPPEQRLEGTAAATAIGIARGADIIRVHDVAFMVRVARMSDAIVRRGAPTT